MSDIQDQVRRRRTFAIISHPDAGKTTLTEKLLLFSGAINIAGSAALPPLFRCWPTVCPSRDLPPCPPSGTPRVLRL